RAPKPIEADETTSKADADADAEPDADAPEVEAEVVEPAPALGEVIDEPADDEEVDPDADDEDEAPRRPRHAASRATPGQVVPYAQDASSKDHALSRYDPMQAYLHEVQRHPLLTPEEEHTLADRYYKTGDVAAAHRLVTANLR